MLEGKKEVTAELVGRLEALTLENAALKKLNTELTCFLARQDGRLEEVQPLLYPQGIRKAVERHTIVSSVTQQELVAGAQSVEQYLGFLRDSMLCRIGEGLNKAGHVRWDQQPAPRFDGVEIRASLVTIHPKNFGQLYY